MLVRLSRRPLLPAALCSWILLLPAPAGADDDPHRAGPRNRLPEFVAGPILATQYDGIGDDLLTAGLGRSGLAGPAPTYDIPLVPTAAELRRNAIHTNYRAVLDITAGGGYGRFYGPNVDAAGNDTGSEGLIAGWEYLAYADRGRGRQNVTLMVQIPDTFDTGNACIVTATSSGSRGIYGAIGSAGEWGLKRGCAVAYTDKGTGNGLHDLMADTVNLIDGTRTTATEAGEAAHFAAGVKGDELAAFNAATPHRVAYKHAHSRQNAERDWGRNTLQAVRLAFYLLNERFGTPLPGGGKAVVLDKRNTLVIASSISNGAGGALAAAEEDTEGLIDGVAVAEPQVQPQRTDGLRIVQGGRPVTVAGRPLLDYFTFANLYQPCAALAGAAAGAPALAFLGIPNPAGAANRCAALAARGLLTGATLAEQAEDALARLHAYGWLPDSDPLHASHYRFASNAIAVTYSNSYGRFGVADHLCGFSFANTDGTGAPAPQNPATVAGIFATGNGVPPTSGVNIVFNDAVGGARLDLLAVSPGSGSADFALDGALCQRALVTGRDPVTGRELEGALHEAAERVRGGIRQVLLRGDLHRKPTIIVHGRADALVPVNHASRAYVAANRQAERERSRLHYVEVTNAQHFDAFLPGGAVFGGYENRFVPLHVYFIRAMDRLYYHLKTGAPLPPSQVVRTVPRGGTPGTAPPLDAGHVPDFAADPAAADRIVFEERELRIPD